MLADTLEKTMAKSRKYERKTTKASKFSNVFKTIVKDNTVQDAIMQSKLADYIKPGMSKSDAIKNAFYNEKSLIVEDPNQFKVEICFNDESNGLPFFRSIMYKLSERAA